MSNNENKPRKKATKENKGVEHWARLSDISYVEGTTINKKKYLKENKLNKDYLIDGRLSNQHAVVLKNKKTGEIVYSIRGTKDKQDLGTDLMIALGIQEASKRYRETDKHFDKVIEKYGKENITITGHSLGASLGDYLAKKNDVNAHLFNVGSPPVLTTKQAITESAKKRASKGRENEISYYHVSHDPLSLGTSFLVGDNDKHIFVEQSADNPHTLNNFLGD